MIVAYIKKMLTAVVLASFVTSIPAQAASHKTVEQATAVLRGMGSAVEYAVKDDASQSAHVKRVLVSLMRVVHGGLVLHNHDLDFNDYHMAWLAVDSVQLLARLGTFLASRIGEIGPDEFEEFFSEDEPEYELEPEEVEIITENSNDQFDDQIEDEEEDDEESRLAKITKLIIEINKLRVVIFPATEALAGLAIATYTDNSTSSKQIRFAAQTIISLLRLSQYTLDSTEDSLARKALIAGLVIHVGHVLYQILYNKSELNRWLMPVTFDGLHHINGVDIGTQCLLCRSAWNQQPDKADHDYTFTLTKTPCGHWFHDDCLSKWFKVQKNIFCPTCDLPTANHLLESIDQADICRINKQYVLAEQEKYQKVLTKCQKMLNDPRVLADPSQLQKWNTTKTNCTNKLQIFQKDNKEFL